MQPLRLVTLRHVVKIQKEEVLISILFIADVRGIICLWKSLKPLDPPVTPPSVRKPEGASGFGKKVSKHFSGSPDA
jgi:hypothetical protein